MDIAAAMERENLASEYGAKTAHGVGRSWRCRCGFTAVAVEDDGGLILSPRLMRACMAHLALRCLAISAEDAWRAAAAC
jgi:hypothetical protein